MRYACINVNLLFFNEQQAPTTAQSWKCDIFRKGEIMEVVQVFFTTDVFSTTPVPSHNPLVDKVVLSLMIYAWQIKSFKWVWPSKFLRYILLLLSSTSSTVLSFFTEIWICFHWISAVKVASFLLMVNESHPMPRVNRQWVTFNVSMNKCFPVLLKNDEFFRHNINISKTKPLFTVVYTL